MELTGSSRRRATPWRMIVVLIGAVAAGGCELLTPDDQMGVIDARVQDDPIPFPEEGDRGDLVGSVEVEMRIWVRTEDGVWTALGPSTRDVVDLQSPSERALHGPQWLQGAWYTHVRVELAWARVDVSSQSGPPVEVGPLTKELDVSDFRLDQDETVFIVVALNVEQWADWAGMPPSPLPQGVVEGAVQAFVNGVTP